jgi:hypothetical protein
MDKGCTQPLYRFEWALCGLWSALWMSIAGMAFAKRHGIAVAGVTVCYRVTRA